MCARCRGEVFDFGGGLEPSQSGSRPELVCIHRGEAVGQMECQCGAVYRCNLLGKLCSKKSPIDNLVHATVGGEKIRLTDDVYQCCVGCDRKELRA